MLLVAIAGIILNATWNVGNSVLGYATNMSSSGLLQATNQQRSQNGKNALALNSKLSQAAQAKANDMAGRNYWSHVTPDGKQPWAFISNAGYSYTSAGENLAYGFDTSTAAVSGWMNSSTHRANLLNSSYREVGFGIVNSSDFRGDGEQTIVVAMYGQPEVVVAPQTAQRGSAPSEPAIEPLPASSKPETTPKSEQPATKGQLKETPAAPAETAIVDNTAAEPQTLTLAAKEVSRIDVLTNGNAQWAALVVSVLAAVSIFALLFSHIKLWRKYLAKGERFIVRHPFFDAAVLAVGFLGFVLTRTSGFIH
jgi:hypothetical protein